MSLFEKFKEITDDATIATIEESGRQTGVSSTAGTTNTMNVVVNVGWKIVVDDMHDIIDVQTA